MYMHLWNTENFKNNFYNTNAFKNKNCCFGGKNIIFIVQFPFSDDIVYIFSFLIQMDQFKRENIYILHIPNKKLLAFI